jgi:hypothetical protein
MNPMPTAGKAQLEISNENPNSDTIQAVRVVPIFTPMIAPIDWVRVRRPALTNETIMTEAADEDWIIAVITKPVSIPTKRFPVMKFRAFFILSPALCCIPSLISFMPKRNMQRPPVMRSSIEKINIFSPLSAY